MLVQTQGPLYVASSISYTDALKVSQHIQTPDMTDAALLPGELGHH
jgi:hypothetical protein